MLHARWNGEDGSWPVSMYYSETGAGVQFPLNWGTLHLQCLNWLRESPNPLSNECRGSYFGSEAAGEWNWTLSYISYRGFISALRLTFTAWCLDIGKICNPGEIEEEHDRCQSEDPEPLSRLKPGIFWIQVQSVCGCDRFVMRMWLRNRISRHWFINRCSNGWLTSFNHSAWNPEII
jgi:hypothetical protein